MDFRLHTALQSGYDSNGFLGVQVDPYGDENAGTAPIPLFQPIGITSRPAEPADASTGTPVIVGTDGASCLAWCGLDRKVQAKLPTLTEGSTCVYAANGAYILLDADAGTISIVHASSDGTTSSTITIDNSGSITITGGTITLTGNVNIGNGGHALLTAPGFIDAWNTMAQAATKDPVAGAIIGGAMTTMYNTYLSTQSASTQKLTSA